MNALPLEHVGEHLGLFDRVVERVVRMVVVRAQARRQVAPAGEGHRDARLDRENAELK